MQYLAVLVVLFVGANAVSKEFAKKIMAEVQEIGMNCAEKVGANADEIQELMDHKLPPSGHGAKCVVACFYEHYNILTPDGKFSKQSAIDSFSRLKDDDEKVYQKVLKLIDICYDKVKIVDDRCESATNMAVCARDEAAALGLTKEIFMGGA